MGTKFRAAVYAGGKLHHVGTYATAKEAAIAYEEAFQKHTIYLERKKKSEIGTGGGSRGKSNVSTSSVSSKTSGASGSSKSGSSSSSGGVHLLSAAGAPLSVPVGGKSRMAV